MFRKDKLNPAITPPSCELTLKSRPYQGRQACSLPDNDKICTIAILARGSVVDRFIKTRIILFWQQA